MNQNSIWSGRGPAVGYLALIARVFREDRCARLLAVYLGLLTLPYLSPFTRGEFLDLYSRTAGYLALIPAALVALRYRLKQVRSRRGRQFWNRLVWALACWWSAALLAVLAPAGWWDFGILAARDALLGGFFLAALLAAARQPHRRNSSSSSSDLLEWTGISVLTLGFFVYLALIPTLTGALTYESGVPSLAFFIALDLIVAFRFFQLSLFCGSAAWRVLYGLLGWTFALWGLFDSLEALKAAGFVEPLGPRWTPLWHIPFLLLVAAARLRHLGTFDRQEARANESIGGDALSWSGSPLPIAVLSLPIVHFVYSLLGFLDDETRLPREITALVCLVVVGGMMLFERHQVGRESLQQNALLESLIEGSPLAIVLLDSEARVITCNPAFESLFVYSRSELIGNKLEEFINTDSTRDEALENVRTVLRGEAIHLVTRRTRRDGSAVDVRLFGIPLRIAGRPKGAFGLYQDISQQKRAEQQLRDSEERFRCLAEATFEGIVISVGGKIVDTNEQFADILGYSRSEILGTSAGDRVAPEYQGMVQERIQSGYSRLYEIDAVHKSGRRVRLEVRGQEMPYRGAIARVTAVRDVTQRRQLEEQLRQSQKMEAIGRLAAGIAHDFNNLLTVIVGRSMLLVDQLEAGSQPYLDAEEITQAAERATYMTGQLLTFGRRQGLEPRVLDLRELVGGLEKMLGRLLREDIELVIVRTVEPVLVKADPVQLEQVLLNLAINAQDAMPEGGRLSVEVLTSVDPSERSAMGLEPGDYVGLVVRDSGIGMDEPTRIRAFEPFFTTKEKGEGTGLGLATVYGIIQQAGGGIVVDSLPGEGTVFRILLPRSQESFAEPEPEPEIPALTAGTRTVLVVEDVQEVCRFVAESLRLCGFEALTAEHPQRALELLESYEGELDLLLTDVAMPEMDGFQLAEKVRELRPGIHVLYMSGYTDSPILRRQGDLSRIVLLRKPFTHADLAKKVAEVLSGPAEP